MRATVRLLGLEETLHRVQAVLVVKESRGAREVLQNVVCRNILALELKLNGPRFRKNTLATSVFGLCCHETSRSRSRRKHLWLDTCSLRPNPVVFLKLQGLRAAIMLAYSTEQASHPHGVQVR